MNPTLGPKYIQIGAWPDAIAAGGRYNAFALTAALKHDPAGLFRSTWRAIRRGESKLVDADWLNGAMKGYVDRYPGFEAAAHVSAAAVRRFDAESWHNYFTFGFVRNPWDHAVSDYYWRTRATASSPVGFKEFLLRIRNPERPDPERIVPPIRSNWSVYSIDGAVVLDFVGRFERLHDDAARIQSAIGVRMDLRGLHAKASVRPSDLSIEGHYDDESIELVREIYRNEIDAFRYGVPF